VVALPSSRRSCRISASHQVSVGVCVLDPGNLDNFSRFRHSRRIVLMRADAILLFLCLHRSCTSIVRSMKKDGREKYALSCVNARIELTAILSPAGKQWATLDPQGAHAWRMAQWTTEPRQQRWRHSYLAATCRRKATPATCGTLSLQSPG